MGERKRPLEPAAIVRAAGYRATLPRIRVLAALQGVRYPLSIKAVRQKLGRPKINQARVYRVLKSFQVAGLVNQIDFRHDCAYYELIDARRDHHHIVCVSCRKVRDFIGCDYGKRAARVLKQAPGFATVTGHALEFFGMCRACHISKEG